MSRVYDWALKNYQRLLESQDQSNDKKLDSARITHVTLNTDEDYDTLESTLEDFVEPQSNVSQASLARFSALE